MNNIFKRSKKLCLKLQEFNITLTLVLIFILILSSLTHSTFFRFNNFINILSYTSITGILAIAVTLVLIIGEIDFSVASIAIMSAVAGGVLIENFTKSFIIIFFVSLATGLFLGLINSLVVRYFEIPSFIATLAMYIIARAGAIWLSKDLIIYIKNVSGYIYLNTIRIFKLPLIVLVFILILIIFLILLRFTGFGKIIYAIGNNSEASYLSGLNVNKWKILLFILSGGLSAIAGVLGCSQIGQIDPLQWGRGYEMIAFSIAILGGASLIGGKGSILGVLQASLILGILSNIMNLFSVSTYLQKVVSGAILIIVVFFDSFMRRRVIGLGEK
ncbi:Ribose import permease protein RbsC [subsurface metagenome]